MRVATTLRDEPQDHPDSAPPSAGNEARTVVPASIAAVLTAVAVVTAFGELAGHWQDVERISTEPTVYATREPLPGVLFLLSFEGLVALAAYGLTMMIHAKRRPPIRLTSRERWAETRLAIGIGIIVLVVAAVVLHHSVWQERITVDHDRARLVIERDYLPPYSASERSVVFSDIERARWVYYEANGESQEKGEIFVDLHDGSEIRFANGSPDAGWQLVSEFAVAGIRVDCYVNAAGTFTKAPGQCTT